MQLLRRYFAEWENVSLRGPLWIGLFKMTATAIIYTSEGFAIAADGRELWEDPVAHKRTLPDGGDEVQKIFCTRREQGTLAYVLRGGVASEHRSFDLEAELRDRLLLLNRSEFNTCADFLGLLATHLASAIKVADQAGKLKEPLEARISFAGYFKNAPSWIDLRFSSHPGLGDPIHQLVEPYPGRDLRPGAVMVSGYPIVRDLILEHDPRFAQFFPQYGKPVHTMPLQEAACYAKGYIDAFASPLALTLDPSCEAIGGHVHVATVTPGDGFQWVVRPVGK